MMIVEVQVTTWTAGLWGTRGRVMSSTPATERSLDLPIPIPNTPGEQEPSPIRRNPTNRIFRAQRLRWRSKPWRRCRAGHVVTMRFERGATTPLQSSTWEPDAALNSFPFHLPSSHQPEAPLLKTKIPWEKLINCIPLCHELEPNTA